MLPTILLQPVELGTPGKSLDTADLLPSDATEPTALFADLLRISAEPVQPDMPPRGIGLPEGGNALPTSLDSGLGTVPEVLVDEPLTSLPAAVRAELTPNSTPTPTPTPTAAGVTPEILRPAPIPAPVAAQLVEITYPPDPVLPETVRRLAPIAAEVATDTGAEELAKVQLAGNCLGAPAACNGKVYVHTTKRLYCFGNPAADTAPRSGRSSPM